MRTDAHDTTPFEMIPPDRSLAPIAFPALAMTLPDPILSDEMIIGVADVGTLALTTAAITIQEHARHSKLFRILAAFTSGYQHEVIKSRIRKQMLREHDPYAGTTLTVGEREAAIQALLTRSRKGLFHHLAGEGEVNANRSTIPDQIRTYLKNTLRTNPTIAEEQFKDDIRKTLRQAGFATGNDIVLTDAWKHFNALRGNASAIQRIDSVLSIRVARIRVGPRTEFHGNGLDRIMRRYIYGHPWEILANPVLIAGALFIAKRVATGTAFTIGQSVGIAVMAGGLAAMRERYDLQRERVEITREIAQGMMGTRGGPTREKNLIRTISDMAVADKMISALRPFYQILHSNGELLYSPAMEALLTNENVLGAIAEAQVRTEISDHMNVDLIDYGDPTLVEQRRLILDEVLAAIHTMLRNETSNPRAALVLQHLLDREEVMREILLADVLQHDRQFARLLRARATRGFFMWGIIAFACGTTLKALFDPASRGIWGNTIFPGSENHMTSFTTPEDGISTQLHFFGPPNAHLVHTVGQNYDLVMPNGQTIHNFLINNVVDQHAKDALHKAGYAVSEKVSNTIHQGPSPVEYLKGQHVAETPVNHTDWAISPHNGIDRSLVSLTYTHPDTNTVMWHVDTSINHASSGRIGYDIHQIIANKRMFMLLRYIDGKGVVHSYTIPVDQHGNAILKSTDPLWKVFTGQNGQFIGNSAQLAEINEGGYTTIFATTPGSGSIPAQIPLGEKVFEIHMTSQGGNDLGSAIMAFPFPRARRPLEPSLATTMPHTHRQRVLFL